MQCNTYVLYRSVLRYKICYAKLYVKALLNVEKENQKTIQSLKTKYQSEIDKYQQKYYEILENLRSTQAALTAAQTAKSPENKTASS